MELAAVALSVLLGMALIVMGLAKLQGLPATRQIRDRLAVPPTVWRVMGGAEMLAAAGLIVGSLANTNMAISGAVLGILSVGTLLAFQVRAREPFAFLVPAVALLALAVVDIALLPASG